MSEQSYKAIVIRQFLKNRPAVISVYIILGIFFLAIFADVLANDKPLTCVIENERYFQETSEGCEGEKCSPLIYHSRYLQINTG